MGPSMGQRLLAMAMWGAGISLAFAGVAALFGERRTKVVVHQAPAATAATKTPGQQRAGALANRTHSRCQSARMRPLDARRTHCCLLACDVYSCCCHCRSGDASHC